MSSITNAEQQTSGNLPDQSAAPPARGQTVMPATRYTDAEIRVLHFVNPLVVALLRSPLHGIASGRLMLLTYTGRKSGQKYTIPVGYTRLGSDLLIFTYYAWWRNLRRGAPVNLNMRGRTVSAWAEAIEESDRVIAEVDRLAAAVGAKEAFARAGIKLSTTPLPTRDELAQALAGIVVIRIATDTSERSSHE